MNRCFKVSKAHANSFSESWVSKNVTWMKLLTWCLNRRMALRTHILPSGRLTKHLFWSWWSVFWRCRKAIRTHFVHLVHWIKRLWWIRLSDVLSSRMVPRTHNLPSGSLKKRLWVSRWSKFLWCRKALLTEQRIKRLWWIRLSNNYVVDWLW
jgi:hypothetical protein